MLNAIRDPFDRYYQQLPEKIPKAAFQSAAFSFSLSMLMSITQSRVTVDKAMTNALLAATVSIVSALTMPIFRSILADQNGRIDWLTFAAKQILILGCTERLVRSFTDYRVDLFFSILYTTWLVSGIWRNFANYPTNSSPIYILLI